MMGKLNELVQKMRLKSSETYRPKIAKKQLQVGELPAVIEYQRITMDRINGPRRF